ncbi:MAG: hypothetical protein QOJ40_1264 [Verrucomicrobiota bacterium]
MEIKENTRFSFLPDRFLRHARVWVSDVRRANAPFSFYFSMI